MPQLTCKCGNSITVADAVSETATYTCRRCNPKSFTYLGGFSGSGGSHEGDVFGKGSKVTVTSSTLQYDRTLDTLKYIAHKDPFNRQNESASVLAFLDETFPDTREATLGGYRIEAGRNVSATQNFVDNLQGLNDPFAEKAERSFKLGQQSDCYNYQHPSTVEQPYERIEDADIEATRNESE